MKLTRVLLGCVVACVAAGPVFAAAPVPFANTFYSSDFETDQSAIWTIDSNPGSGAGSESINHNFAYTSLDGITGTGVKVIANDGTSLVSSSSAQTTLDIAALTGGAVTEITGSYQLQVDAWMSYSHAGPGAGTSEHAFVGLNTTPGIATSYFSGNTVSGTYLFNTVDADVGNDIILRDSITPLDGLTTVKDPSNSDLPYQHQLDTASVGNGAVINGWTTFTLQYNAVADTFNFWIDGTEIPFEDPLLFVTLDQNVQNSSGVTSGAVSLGLFDAAGGSSAFPEDQFVIYDNVVITTENDLLTAALVGDLDDDGFVGITDLNLILGVWNTNVTPGNKLAGDPSGDGFVGIEDLNVVLGNWNAGVLPPPGSVVPEPASLAVLGMGGFAMLRRRN